MQLGNCNNDKECLYYIQVNYLQIVCTLSTLCGYFNVQHNSQRIMNNLHTINLL